LATAEDFLDLLKDETWHTIKDIAEKLGLTTEQTANTAKALAQQNLIQYNEKAGWLKINPEYKTLLTNEEKPPHKPAIGSIILPTKETITIQDVQVTNITDTNLELLIRTCKKQTKLAIKTYP
jgi:hypothetical protein